MGSWFRVPDGMSDPERTAEGWSSKLSLPVDEDGFFGRECPNQDCLRYFKLHGDDYQLARVAHSLTCPLCGTTESDEHFHTPDQVERMHAGAMELARGALDNVLRDFARRPPVRSAGGAITVRWNAPDRAHIPNPLPSYVERQTIRTFTCPNGGHRAVIYDLLAFCPYCGPGATPPRAVFDDNLAAMRRVLQVVEELPEEAKAAVAAAGGATVLTERALTNTVAALQNLAKQLHAQAGKSMPSANPWQNADRLRRQWRDDFGRDPFDAMDPETVQTLRLALARRHVVEHNGGVVDERYRRETDEGTVGRRLRLRPAFVENAFIAAAALADRLEEIARA